jgi:hypothetical protein
MAVKSSLSSSGNNKMLLVRWLGMLMLLVRC